MIEFKQFNAKTVLPKDDRVLYDLIINKSGVIYGCELSHVASNQVSITAGYGVIKGGLFVITTETIACAQTSSGTLPGRIYIKLDLSNTTTPISILTTCNSPLPALSQDENVNNTNGVYEIELATYTASTTSISDLVTTVATIESVNKVVLHTLAEVMANTEENRVVDALAMKALNNSLTWNLIGQVTSNNVLTVDTTQYRELYIVVSRLTYTGISFVFNVPTMILTSTIRTFKQGSPADTVPSNFTSTSIDVTSTNVKVASLTLGSTNDITNARLSVYGK